MKNSIAVRKPVATFAINAATTAITFAAWVQLIASLGATASQVSITNSTAGAVRIGVGAAAAEADVLIIGPGASLVLPVEQFTKGIRVAARAVTADLATGFIVINFLA